jgi:hypothetical protein
MAMNRSRDGNVTEPAMWRMTTIQSIAFIAADDLSRPARTAPGVLKPTGAKGIPPGEIPRRARCRKGGLPAAATIIAPRAVSAQHKNATGPSGPVEKRTGKDGKSQVFWHGSQIGCLAENASPKSDAADVPSRR